MINKFKYVVGLIATILLALHPAIVSADATFYSLNNILFYDENPTSTCVAGPISAGKDYSGKEILSEAQKKAISENKSVYEEAGSETGVAWQVIATLHLKETGLSTTNPANKQGLYQEYAARNSDKYPPGQVDRAEFLKQSIWAGNFIKGKTSISGIRDGDTRAIKDAFFGYNGRASVYKEQASRLGFSDDFEGSPYVMNRADAKRDPTALPSGDRTWGQIKRDAGSIEYPANETYGAFVVYSSIANISGNDCSGSRNGSLIDKVVSISEEELALWDSGKLSGNGSSFKKYTNNQSGNWCAWFVSWVYNEAGYPISETSKNGEVPAVVSIQSIGQDGSRFTYNQKGSYTPKVGDIVIQRNNASHVHIVTEVDGNNITTIGGNQGFGSGGGQATSFLNSKVTKYTYDFTQNSSVSGFVSAKV